MPYSNEEERKEANRKNEDLRFKTLVFDTREDRNECQGYFKMVGSTRILEILRKHFKNK